MKYIPINGLKITNSFALHWFGVNNVYDFLSCPSPDLLIVQP